ncbi:MAG: hypothetical protein FWD70_02910 [Desulfuromonadales bacterium]|nr:hypothetical protein [Desulfuromonadales bacterium]
MDNINSSVAFFLLIVAFGIGYFIVSILFKTLKSGNKENPNNQNSQAKPTITTEQTDLTNKDAATLELNGNYSATQPELETFTCPGCGASGTKPKGVPGNCEYCGSAIK